MRIILDAMGGDNAPASVVTGALMALDKLKDIEIVLVGRRGEILEQLKQQGHSSVPAGMIIEHAEDVVDMHDDPVLVVKERGESSMVKALKMLQQGEGDALISAGNTGALITGATLIVRRIKGVRRAALGIEFPTGREGKYTFIVDCGANAECTAEYLLQFAYMGSFYMQNQYKMKEKATVALLNNGTEESKGTELHQATYALLKEASEKGSLKFIGNVEARDLFSGVADVIVTDGFSGNILLKAAEGTVGFVMQNIKQVFLSGLKSKIAYLLTKNGLKSMKSKLDYKEVGGTPLLGISKPVIKAHGSSDGRAIFNAVRQAVEFASGDIISNIEANMRDMRLAAADKVGEN